MWCMFSVPVSICSFAVPALAVIPVAVPALHCVVNCAACVCARFVSRSGAPFLAVQVVAFMGQIVRTPHHCLHIREDFFECKCAVAGTKD